MPEYISNNLTTIIVALVAVLVGGIVIIRFIIKSKRIQKSHSVKQSKNIVGGDQAGGDINKFNSK